MPHSVPWRCLALTGVAVLLCLGQFQEPTQAAPAAPFAQRFLARPFPDGVRWLNASRPIQLRELRGKFVLLDFWTLGCINCMHIIPELRRLEKAWPNELVVIGVHSAKFEREKDTKSIQEAILRYRIAHPVVNDADFAIWNAYGVRAWPSLVLIDPEGYAVWAHSGEATFEQVDALLKKAVPYYRVAKTLDSRPMRFELESAKVTETPLRFPGKILVDAAGRQLFIADSGHNRIVVTGLDGSLRDTIGSGTLGRADGDYATATFNTPQGMAIDGESLYVADTENHLLRKVDLVRKRVVTIAGTGSQNRGTSTTAVSRRPLGTALSSPWDIWLHRGDLYIAMAGVHQIWIMKLDGSGIGVYAGSGLEDIVDGALRPRRAFDPGFAAFAQPSGLSSDGQWLYVADSEGSSIRAVPFNVKKAVRTIVGTARLPAARLFTFGDVDGPSPAVRLQHPLGVAYYEGQLYVADTYNNKIKTINPETGETRTIAGSTTPGRTDDPPAFDQPGGIAAAAGKLYVADTNNHLVRAIDLGAANSVTTLEISGLEPR